MAAIKGGAFLIEETAPEGVFTAEDLNEEHDAVGRTADAFWTREVAPNLEAVQHQEPGVALRLLRKAAELGLTAITIPEQYGGMELDLASAMVAAEHLAKDGSYAGWHGAHSGIGTLPLLYFGTEEQKRRYLPKLASAQMLAAYALTEPQAGSDALAARTTAVMNVDRTHYVLNGQKMWITNGGHADLFTVFAKVDGEHFTAFLVERGFGLISGAEEKKMGIKGSSTTAIYLDNVWVPVENVLGEVGRGHIIAFNILNLGRLKLGASALGAAKNVLALSLRYADERKAFGSSIGEFGAIQCKLAEMAIRIFATESILWRTVGAIQPDQSLKGVEEFAVECSVVKVYGSEMLDYVVDEGVQIHGGYGYHQDYAVERAYRDARINRIFEGTNEINRLLIPGMLLKRAARGRLGLMEAAQRVMEETAGGPAADESDEEMRLVRNARKIALLALGLAHQSYGAELDKAQEVLMGLADMAMEVYAMESSLLRARKTGKGCDMCSVLLRDAMARVEVTARGLLAACLSGEALRANMLVLRRLAMYEPVDALGMRRMMAARLLGAERYVV
jgi:alkylation response protein AidB-like acyl-CoA dehydrogenase